MLSHVVLYPMSLSGQGKHHLMDLLTPAIAYQNLSMLIPVVDKLLSAHSGFW